MSMLNGENYDVFYEPESRTVIFSGTLRLSGMDDYAPILDLLRSTLDGSPAPVTLDLRELEFLNSSGITMFSKFVIEVRECARAELHLLASKDIPWHSRSLKNLQRLMPSLSIDLA